MKKCIAKFNPNEVFQANDEVAQFIIVLTQIHSNISLTQSYLLATHNNGELKEIHGDSYIYFLSMLLGHTREALKTINSWMEESKAVNRLVNECNLDEFRKKIIFDKKSFEELNHTQYLIQTRNDIFHYTQFTKRQNLEKTIDGVNRNLSETKVFDLGDNKAEFYMDYSGQLIAGLVSRNTFTEAEFRERFEPISPIIVSIIKFCNGVISLYLSKKGIQFDF